ncbi:MAG: glycosyltransferase family 2 protein [Acidobacteria bacterium]|nr:glycosyltransferase family 2 protein [Acidobacteriota bacterium]
MVVGAGAIDLLIVTSLDDVDPLPVKLLAVACAASVRALFYRVFLLRILRSEIDRPADRPLAPAPYRISVVVPALCEEDRIGQTVARLGEELAVCVARSDLEIVVVDDGSDDRTAEAAREAGADQVIRLEANLGKGGAVRAGIRAATGQFVAFTDADLAYEPAQLIGLIERLEQGYDVAIGSRRHAGATEIVGRGLLREMGSRVVNLATHLLLIGQYRDTQCGIKAFRGDVAQVLFAHTRINGFAFDVELLHLVERYRISLVEVPVSVSNSERSTVRIGRDTVRLFSDLLRIRHNSRRGLYALTPAEHDVLGAPSR